jgi:hypothetical protein
VDGTPTALYWQCRACQHPWTTTPTGVVIE